MQVPGQVQRGSGDGSEGSGEGLAGFGAERVQEALVQSLLNLTWLCTKASQTFSGTFSRTLLHLPWLCTKASQNLFRNRILALHQSLPHLLRNLLWNQVKFNRVPKKVPEKVPGGFGAEPGQAQQGSEPCLVQSQLRFSRVPEKVPEKVWEVLVQSQAKFNRVQEKVWEALAQSQVRFNRVPEKVPEKVWEALVQSQDTVPEKVLGGFGAEPGEVQQGSGEGSGEGLGGFGAEPGQVQQDLRPFNRQKPS